MASESRTLIPGVAVQAPPAWGIEPVPQAQRRLNALDFAVLWGDLGVGLLVLAAGALLVPGLGTADALLATLVGSVIGVLLLALAAYIAADAGVPTMVLTRAAVGLRGSALPTLLNVVQLLGWTSFEILVMAQFADGIVQSATGVSIYPLWAFIAALFCTAMAVGGPLVVVRQWLEKFGVWAMLVTTLALFALLALRYDLGTVLAERGTGELGFWAAVDIVVSLPVSWFPLVADYNRFARSRGASFWGTLIGYFLANVSFFSLGILYVLALKSDPNHLNGDLVAALAGSALGWLGLLIILADETDEGFANIYSTAVSAQNILTRAPQRLLIAIVGAVGFGLAILLQNTDYEVFLLLIGSFFVPLLGVVTAHYFVARRGRYDSTELFVERGSYWYQGGVNVLAVAVWLVGFLLYQWISPVGPVAELGLPPFPVALGGTIPSFVVTFALYAILGRLAARK